MAKKNIGSSLDDFLQEEGLYEDCQATAIKRVLSYQLQQALEEQEISKTRFAQQMGTSRSALDRLLDPDNESATLETMKKAANALGMHLEIRLTPATRQGKIKKRAA